MSSALFEPCPCNGFCSIFATNLNLTSLEAGKVMKIRGVTIEEMEGWQEGGCPLSKIILSNTKGRHAEIELASSFSIGVPDVPQFITMEVHHTSAFGSPNRLQRLQFGVPSSNGRNQKRKDVEVYAVPDTSAAKHLKTHIADPDHASDWNYQLARSWIEECQKNHPACQRTDRLLPTRLIDVNPLSDPDIVHLHATNQQISSDYVALSYCWGKQQTFITTKETLSSNIEGMQLSSLHKTIRDAVQCTRNIGFRFLWVDALCIIQDSPEDKFVEIAKMGSIYANASLTISASNAADCDSGFLLNREDITGRYEQRSDELKYLCPDGEMGKIFLVPVGHDYLNDPRKEVIYERGWTHQERMLSPRILTYGHRQLSWHCLTRSHCDFDIDVLNFGPSSTEIRKFLHRSGDFDVAQSTDKPGNDVAYDWWYEIVGDYSSGKLSVLQDKLVALSATARCFGLLLKQEYVAGIWNNDLIRGLMWYSSRPTRRRSHHWRRKELRAPTWSWASIDAGIAYPQQYFKGSPDFTAKATAVVTLANAKSPFGEVVGGKLLLSSFTMGPFTLKELVANFQSRTLPYEIEEPQNETMGYVYPDENNELLMGSGSPSVENEYWLAEISRLGRVKNGMVLLQDKAKPGIFSRTGFFSLNTNVSETIQQLWESAAEFRRIEVT